MKTKKTEKTTITLEVTPDELYAIEREFDRAYSAMFDKGLFLDKQYLMTCMEIGKTEGKEELKKINRQQKDIVDKAFVLYHGITKKCEEKRRCQHV